MSLSLPPPRGRPFSSRSLSGPSGGLRRGVPALLRGSGGSVGGGIAAVSVDRSLLTPLDVSVDPELQELRREEKEQIKSLNDKFAAFIDKVRFLEQQNKLLETKWGLLRAQPPPAQAGRGLGALLEGFVGSLRRQLEGLGQERQRLRAELGHARDAVDEFKAKFEAEISQRTEKENEFVLLKKDVDEAYMAKVELETRVESLTDEIDFLRRLCQEELQALRSQGSDTSVVVSMDNSRSLDMGQVLAEVRARFQDIAGRSRAEAEGLYQGKYEELQVRAGRQGQELRDTREQIQELNRGIRRVRAEIEALKNQRSALEAAVSGAEQRGERSLRDARAKLGALEAALQESKQDLARQLREYQELLNVKLALDIEIQTYRKLLEGEESRLEVAVQTLSIPPKPSGAFVGGGLGGGFVGGGLLMVGEGSSAPPPPPPGGTPPKSRAIVIKRIETRDGRLVCESSDLLQG